MKESMYESIMQGLLEVLEDTQGNKSQLKKEVISNEDTQIDLEQEEGHEVS